MTTAMQNHIHKNMAFGTLAFCFNVILIFCCFSSSGAQNNETSPTNVTLADVMLLFPDRVLNPYEYICQSTHNNLRQIHSVKTMSWNNFFVSLADSKVILLLQNNTGPSALENFSKQFLKEGELLFATDEVTVAVTRDDLLTSDNWFAFVAKHVDEILRKWYLNGLYGLPEDNGYFTEMLDPQASELGCAVRMKIIERTTVRLFLVVSYHKNIPEVIVARDFSYLLPDTGRYCWATCGKIREQCVSYGSASKRLAGREGGVVQPMSNSDRCVCKGQKGDQERPSCTGVCFAHCPGAAARQKNACHGKVSCHCEPGSGNAVCA